MAVEDFTDGTWIEADPNGRLSQTATRASFDGLTRSEDAWLSKNKGVGHFSGNFTHLFTFFLDSVATGDNSLVSFLSLGNSLVNFATLLSTGPGLMAYKQSGSVGSGQLVLREKAAGQTDSFDVSVGLSEGTIYYCEWERDESIGSFGQLDCRIYSDLARTTLVDTITVTLKAKDDFQYVFTSHGYGGGGGGGHTATGYTENIDFQEGSVTEELPLASITTTTFEAGSFKQAESPTSDTIFTAFEATAVTSEELPVAIFTVTAFSGETSKSATTDVANLTANGLAPSAQKEASIDAALTTFQAVAFAADWVTPSDTAWLPKRYPTSSLSKRPSSARLPKRPHAAGLRS